MVRKSRLEVKGQRSNAHKFYQDYSDFSNHANGFAVREHRVVTSIDLDRSLDHMSEAGQGVTDRGQWPTSKFISKQIDRGQHSACSDFAKAGLKNRLN